MELIGSKWPQTDGEGVSAPFFTMYTIYLRHPRHGTKVAISDMEASHDEEHGWVRYNPDMPSEEDEEDRPVNSLVRRGRPPKNRDN